MIFLLCWRRAILFCNFPSDLLVILDMEEENSWSLVDLKLENSHVLLQLFYLDVAVLLSCVMKVLNPMEQFCTT